MILEQVQQAIHDAKIDQFDLSKLNPSHTKLGPCMQQFGKISPSSWWPPQPWPESYIEKMLLVGEKYKDLSWLPLALPKIEIGDFSIFEEIWSRESIEIIRTDNPLWLPEFKGLHITANCLLDFNLHDLYVNGKMTKIQISDEAGYSQGRPVVGKYAKKLYKNKFFFNLISQIMDLFPIQQISNILILEQIGDVAPHREQSWVWKCPTEFRVMLHDENTEPTLYVGNIETGKVSYINLPEDTNSFCWSNGTHVYGIDYHGRKSYQLIVNAVWNADKIDKLIERSISKYGIK
jgi:hypothetical protein